MNAAPRTLGMLAVVGMSALTACGGTTTATPTATVTQTTVVTMSATPTPTPTEVRTSTAPDTSSNWVMPNRVGSGLQDSQDAIQAITGNPLYVTRSHDALEEGRFQVIDSNWKVCSQSPTPGTHFTTDTDIVFNVVKLSESCP